MLRHSVIWRLRDTTTPALQTEMLEGLAYLRMECPMVLSGDYGDDLFGGSRRFDNPPPFEATPVWRRAADGPPANYDVALHLDFDDWDAYRQYSPHPAHKAGSVFNGAVSWDELTARVDWYVDGEAPNRRGHVRHVAMFVWADGVPDQTKQRALDAVRALGDAPGVEAVTLGHNVGQLVSDYDWIMDVHAPDRAAAERLLRGSHYARAMDAVAAATKYEWTARLSHIMRGP
ncbi:MAG: antibiotic biosynthesis monooxygenase family protein [bacterium]